MRFKLKTLLLILVVLTITFAIVYQWADAPRRHHARVQASLGAIGAGKIEGAVLYEPPRETGKLSRYHVDNLLELHFENTKVQNDDLKHVRILDPQELLNLDTTEISDAGLHHLYGLRVKKIILTNTNVTSHGIAKLKSQVADDCVVISN